MIFPGSRPDGRNQRLGVCLQAGAGEQIVRVESLIEFELEAGDRCPSFVSCGSCGNFPRKAQNPEFGAGFYL